MAQPKLPLCFAQIPAGDRSDTVRAAIDLLVRNLLDHEVLVYVPGRLKEWRDILARQPKKADLPKGKTLLRWVEERRELFLKERGLGAPRAKPGWHKFGFPLPTTPIRWKPCTRLPVLRENPSLTDFIGFSRS